MKFIRRDIINKLRIKIIKIKEYNGKHNQMILKLRYRRNSVLFEIKTQLFQNNIADATFLVKITCIFCTILYFMRQKLCTFVTIFILYLVETKEPEKKLLSKTIENECDTYNLHCIFIVINAVNKYVIIKFTVIVT